MGIDRGSYARMQKSVGDLKNNQSELENSLMKTKGQGRPGFLTISEGYNYFRFFPAPLKELNNPDPKAWDFAQPKVVVSLPILQDEYVDNKATGKKILKSKDVFNARIHGNASLDIVEEYFKKAEVKIKAEFTDEKQRKEKLKIINGFFNQQNNAQSLPGLIYKYSYIVYAFSIDGDKLSEPGRLELRKSIQIELNKIAEAENSGNEMGLEPFTDPTDGIAVQIAFNKKPNKEKKEEYYVVSLYKPKVPGKPRETIYFELSDAQLEWLENQPSLYELYNNCFTIKDFDLQVQGLENFDEKYKLGIFEDEEFLMLVAEQQEYWQSKEPVKNEEETKVDSKVIATQTQDVTPETKKRFQETIKKTPTPEDIKAETAKFRKEVIQKLVEEQPKEETKIPIYESQDDAMPWETADVQQNEITENNAALNHLPENEEDSDLPAGLAEDEKEMRVEQPEPEQETKTTGMSPAMKARIESIKNRNKVQ